MKSYLFLVVFMALAIYTMSTPSAFAPPICSGVFDIDPQQCIPADVPSTPEPGTMALMAIGLGGAALLRRKNK